MVSSVRIRMNVSLFSFRDGISFIVTVYESAEVSGPVSPLSSSIDYTIELPLYLCYYSGDGTSLLGRL